MPRSTTSPDHRPPPPFWRRLVRWGLWSYLALLAASTLVRFLASPEPPLRSGEQRVGTFPVEARSERPGSVDVAYLDLDATDPGAPVLVVLHGSPGDNGQVGPLSRALAGRYRVIAPDLPGFGASTRKIPDYSVTSHAQYVRQLLDSLGVARAHLIGYSMGGGVALELADETPERVRSLTLISSIGVQEYELLGDYTLNHAIHGLQLAGLWSLRELIPHFGWMDDVFLSVEYARNFYDTDQRPLRRALERWEGPMLIIQGSGDVLVPPGIAEEHGRIVPQSEVQVWPGGHFMVFTEGGMVADSVAAFVDRVERGLATTRATASPTRLAEAATPFDPSRIPKPMGFSLLVLLVLLAASTLASEDLACIAAGLLVSRGTIAFFPATLACLIGITVGDMLLFLMGRLLGRPAIRRAPLRWFVTEEDVERSSRWFRRQGLRLVLATRFMPGTRMPTYVAAGVLRTRWVAFSIAFLIASALWTPLLVGVSALLGGRMMEWIVGYEQVVGWMFLVGLLTIFLLVRTGVALSTWRGRRLLLSRWRRITRWEFWPVWVLYAPVAVYVLWLGLKHRSLTVFTAANTAIPGGGLIGESKAAILDGLGASGGVASHLFLPSDISIDDGVQQTSDFMTRENLEFPLVLKPDVGERGRGVAIVETESSLRNYLESSPAAVLVQEHVPGVEFGVFYYRTPVEGRGRILSMTEKRFPTVVGDGRRTLEQLILANDRAVCSARRFLRAHARRLDEVVAAEEIVPLTRLGTHRLGAVFLDGREHVTAALTEAVDTLSRGYEGFWFGRYDVRADTLEELEEGRFRVIELNGVSSEATHIYDPRYSLLQAWGILLRQWSLAFEIGAQNVARGARPTSLRVIRRLFGDHARAKRGHADLYRLTPVADSPEATRVAPEPA